MFRKLALALAATAALGTASLAVGTTPGRSQAYGFHKHHPRPSPPLGDGHRLPRLRPCSYAYSGCYVKRWVVHAVAA